MPWRACLPRLMVCWKSTLMSSALAGSMSRFLMRSATTSECLTPRMPAPKAVNRLIQSSLPTMGSVEPSERGFALAGPEALLSQKG